MRHAPALLAPLLAAALLPAAARAVTPRDVSQATTWRIVAGADGWIIGSVQEAAGDVDGDGRGDLALHGFKHGGESRAWVVFGQPGSGGTIDLSALGARGFAIDGAVPGHSTGGRLDGAGDVNGDGLDDVVLTGDHERSDGSRTTAAYVVYGKTDSATVDLGALRPDAGWRIAHEGPLPAGRTSGVRQVSRAGDVDGDGDGDVAVSAYRDLPGGRTAAQSVWIVPGGAAAGDLDLSASAATRRAMEVVQPVLRYGRADRQICDTLEEAGDVGASPLPDLLLACRNGASALPPTYRSTGNVLFGRPILRGRHNLSRTLKLLGAPGEEDFGTAAGLGDVNGDGRGDLAFGSAGTGADTNHPRGRMVVVYGRGGTGTLRSDRLGLRGLRLEGAEPDDHLGVGMAAGDVAGDERDDLVLSANDLPSAPDGHGELWFLPGLTATGTMTVDAVPGAERLDATAEDPVYATAPVSVGDFDGDGRPDVAVGSIHLAQNAPEEVLVIPLPFG